MKQHELLAKLNGFKGNISHLINRFKNSEANSNKVESEIDDSEIDNFVDDLPLTLNRDPSPGIKFYDTENSEYSRDANKESAHGIDSFGEEDTYEIEEADDYQTMRDRKQNSDLSKRFFTDGMDLDDLNMS